MKQVCRFLLVIMTVALAGCGPSKDDGLGSLKAKLAELRKQPAPRDEDVFPPVFFAARNDLRDWVERRLATFGEKDAEYEFSTKLNQALKDAKLVCAQCAGATGAFADGSGYVGDVRMTRADAGVLEVATQLGVQCGYDEVAYLYRFQDGKWNRFWESGERSDGNGKYEPRRIEAVRISKPGEDGGQVVLSLSRFHGCKAADWEPVFYGLSTAVHGGQAQTRLVSERAMAYVGNTRNAPIYARLVGDDDLLVEFSGASIDPSIRNRVKVAHYRVTRGKAEKIVPYALSPRDFVEEWLTNTWETARDMTAEDLHAQLAAEHGHFHSDRLSVKFDGPTVACQESRESAATAAAMRFYNVQVHVIFHNLRQLKEEERYFRLKWVPPFMFEVVGLTDAPSKTCDDIEPAIDTPRSLFGRRR